MEESRILLWHRDKLKLSIIRDEFLQTVLDHILSRDVINKLIQVSKCVTCVESNQLLRLTYTSKNYQNFRNFGILFF